jgi:hypothetical protein
MTWRKPSIRSYTAGTFVAPYDMHPQHRQFSPLYVADKTTKFLKEAAAALQRNRAAKAGGVIENELSTNVQHPPPATCVYTSICPEGTMQIGWGGQMAIWNFLSLK